jgi:hypothetical protein
MSHVPVPPMHIMNYQVMLALQIPLGSLYLCDMMIMLECALVGAA